MNIRIKGSPAVVMSDGQGTVVAANPAYPNPRVDWDKVAEMLWAKTRGGAITFPEKGGTLGKDLQALVRGVMQWTAWPAGTKVIQDKPFEIIRALTGRKGAPPLEWESSTGKIFRIELAETHPTEGTRAATATQAWLKVVPIGGAVGAAPPKVRARGRPRKPRAVVPPPAPSPPPTMEEPEKVVPEEPEEPETVAPEAPAPFESRTLADLPVPVGQEIPEEVEVTADTGQLPEPSGVVAAPSRPEGDGLISQVCPECGEEVRALLGAKCPECDVPMTPVKKPKPKADEKVTATEVEGLPQIMAEKVRVKKDWEEEYAKLIPKPPKPGDIMQKPYVRRYFPGMDMSDIETLKKAYFEHQNVLLQGPPGSGKSRCLEELARELQIPYQRVEMHGGMEISDLLGTYVPSSTEEERIQHGDFMWNDGLLTVFVKRGGIFVADEINAMPPELTSKLHGLLDFERRLNIPEKKGRHNFPAHPGFMFVASMNPDVEGLTLSDPMMDRFDVVLNYDYDEKIEAQLQIPEKLSQFARKCRLAKTEEIIDKHVSTRMLLQFMKNTDLYGENGAKYIIVGKFNKESREAVRQIYEAVVERGEDIDIEDIKTEG